MGGTPPAMPSIRPQLATANHTPRPQDVAKSKFNLTKHRYQRATQNLRPTAPQAILRGGSQI